MTQKIRISSFDPEAHRGPLPSPCVNICQMDAHSGLCIGCFRNIDEIIAWSSATEDKKRAVWREIKHRYKDNKRGV